MSMPQPETFQSLARHLSSGNNPCAVSHSSFQTSVGSLKMSFCCTIFISFFSFFDRVLSVKLTEQENAMDIVFDSNKALGEIFHDL